MNEGMQGTMNKRINEQINEQMDDKEWISALVDGQYAGEDLQDRLEALGADPQDRERWQAYHLVGDVLRAQDLAASTDPAAFMAALSRRLAAERAPQPAPPPSRPRRAA